jgi:hypothetical protein
MKRLKGLIDHMNILVLKAYKIKSVFSVHVKFFFNLLVLKRKVNFKFLLAPLKKLTNFTNKSESRIRISGLAFLLVGKFSTL